MARQPILTKDEKAFGYELLFRDGIEDHFCPRDPEAASKIMLDGSLIHGTRRAVQRRTRLRQLHSGHAAEKLCNLLPSSQTVVEIRESVEPDDLVMAA